jgi:hypothetical protein
VADWYLYGSSVLLPLYNEPFVEDLVRRYQAVRHPRDRFLNLAAWQFIQVQEAFGKVLNAVEQRNAEGISLLLFDAVRHVLITLSFLNEKPFTTFAMFITEARSFRIKPDRFDDLLDIVVHGSYQHMDRLRETLLVVFGGMEQLLAAEGIELYDQSIDPNVPNRRYE